MKVRASVKPICDKCKVIRCCTHHLREPEAQAETEVIGGQDGTYSRC